DSWELDDRISWDSSSESDSAASWDVESSVEEKQAVVENPFSESNSPTVFSSSSSEEEEEEEEDYDCDTSEITTTTSDNQRTESSELESLWEHQDLIEQLKMEMKKVRATGLPTILEEEESESLKALEDLRPWKMDEFGRGDCSSSSSSMGEVHKFYRSYRERMRKFDVMNYQKMYAIGFLQLKDPLKTMSATQKQSTSSSSSSSSSIFRRNRIHGADPRTKKFMAELQSDLETIYVGQMCLSWEFLHWQYQKALDLLSCRDGDGDGQPAAAQRRRRRSSHYNEVAGEFQQFQVLLQRFVEDEPFRPPRLQNYVENRCVFRNLLQVPVIREDNFKDRRKNWSRDSSDEYAITGEMLVAILEESIRIFWQFVRADPDSASIRSIIGNNRRNIPDEEQQDHRRLLLDAIKIIRKKEKKLKEVLRSDACILKKLRRRWGREDDEECSDDPVLCFFSQVDMKLVARVLNMSRITMEQLIWCHSKLSKITFSHRKIHIEPSFLLFPC
ncbi:hypothetical protein M569_05836, partial [Genlisea aurea]